MNAESETSQYKCANPQCRVSESGKCLEGLALGDCPTYGREGLSGGASEKEADAEPADRLVHLRSATSLPLHRASELLRSQEGRVIAIVGPREAGKTSLIASLFDLFQEGPVGEISFAGSETLHAFELACHNSRAASRRIKPVQEHTGHGEVRFYHLNIANGTSKLGMTLLFGDRAGENYLTASDDLAQAGPFPEISRADTVTILVDGGRLLDNKTRHNTRSETGLMVRAMTDGGFFENSPRVVFVLTKLDAIRASQHKDRAVDDFEKVVQHAKSIADAHAHCFEQVHIAAAPVDTTMPRGTGVDELVKFWIRPVARASRPNIASEPADRKILNLRMPSQESGAGV